MSITIIVKEINPKGRTRTSTDEQLGHKWGTSSFKDESDKDKCAFIERKLKKLFNADNSRVNARWINDVLTDKT